MQANRTKRPKDSTISIDTSRCGTVRVVEISLTGWELLREKLAAALQSGVVQEVLSLIPAVQSALESIGDGPADESGSTGQLSAIGRAISSAKDALPSVLAKIGQGIASHVDVEVLQHCVETDEGADLNQLTAREFMEIRAAAMEVNDVSELLETEKNFWRGLIVKVRPKAPDGSATSSESAEATG